MKRRLTALLIASASTSASAVNVTVTNPSFESPALAGSNFVGTIPGWQDGDQGGGNAGVFNPTLARYPGGGITGNNVAFSNGPFISQVLTETLVAGASYNLQVDVGDRNDTPFPIYTIQLRAGGNVLAQTSSPTPADGGFATAVVNFNAPLVHADLNKPLEVRLITGGVQANYDNVRLTTTLANPFTPIAITNPGFEADVLGENVSIAGAAGWTVAGGGAFNPQANQSFPTEGSNVLFSNGGTASQVLSTTLQGGKIYALSVDLIDRFDTAFPSYRVQLFAGGVLLAEEANLQSVTGADFKTAMVNFSTLDNAFAAQFGQPLEIRLVAGGVQANFDNVRLGFVAVPEPATATLGLLSVAGLMMRRRRMA